LFKNNPGIGCIVGLSLFNINMKWYQSHETTIIQFSISTGKKLQKGGTQ